MPSRNAASNAPSGASRVAFARISNGMPGLRDSHRVADALRCCSGGLRRPGADRRLNIIRRIRRYRVFVSHVVHPGFLNWANGDETKLFPDQERWRHIAVWMRGDPGVPPYCYKKREYLTDLPRYLTRWHYMCGITARPRLLSVTESIALPPRSERRSDAKFPRIRSWRPNPATDFIGIRHGK